VKTTPDRRRRDVHDRGVQHDDEIRHRKQRQRQPAASTKSGERRLSIDQRHDVSFQADPGDVAVCDAAPSGWVSTRLEVTRTHASVQGVQWSS
jgi:hypothetical protein